MSEYAAGRPHLNPCLRCNEKINFAAVLDRAKAMGALMEWSPATMGPATPESEWLVALLHRASDPLKDQSYVVWRVLNREQIDGAFFPLGDTEKCDIRIEGRKARTPAVAQKTR